VVENNNIEDNENSQKPEEASNLDAKQDGIGLFLTDKERKQILKWGQELVHDVLREPFILYRIDYKTTKTHRLYGEALIKNYLPPVEILGRINVEVEDPSHLAPGGLLRQGLGILTADVYLHHLEEREVEIRMGDYIYHKSNFYEIINDGSSNISNEYALGGDKLFFITIKAVEVNTDVFQAR